MYLLVSEEPLLAAILASGKALAKSRRYFVVLISADLNLDLAHLLLPFRPIILHLLL